MAYHQPFQITGFHSCDREIGLKVLNGKDQLTPSDNLNRLLDCAVMQYVQQINKESGRDQYDTIRSAFVEGDPIYDGSNFYERLHIEICVINPDLIKGYFLPMPISDFNPYLSREFVKSN